jgi:hypothetical protein
LECKGKLEKNHMIKRVTNAASTVSEAASKQLIETATRELTGIPKAALAAGHRMAALERAAEAIHAKTLLSCTARVTSSPEAGLHALLTDAHGVTIEISGGQLAAAISKE